MRDGAYQLANFFSSHYEDSYSILVSHKIGPGPEALLAVKALDSLNFLLYDFSTMKNIDLYAQPNCAFAWYFYFSPPA